MKVAVPEAAVEDNQEGSGIDQEFMDTMNQCPEGMGFHIPGRKKCVPNPKDNDMNNAVAATGPNKYEGFNEDAFDLKKAYYDNAAVDWIAVASIVGTLIWVWSMLYYAATDSNDLTFATYGEPPLAWFWTHLMDGSLGWTAASYFAFFWGYALISVVEFGSWCMYISGDTWFFAVWSVVATWGGLILYALPPLFAAL